MKDIEEHFATSINALVERKAALLAEAANQTILVSTEANTWCKVTHQGTTHLTHTASKERGIC